MITAWSEFCEFTRLFVLSPADSGLTGFDRLSEAAPCEESDVPDDDFRKLWSIVSTSK